MTRFITYTTRHYDKLIQAVLEHFEIVGLTLVISIALAFMIAMLVMEHKRITAWITRVFSMIYAIPSLALFALLLPVTGLGMQTAVLVLVIYNQFILIQSFTDGFTSVDAGVLEAAARYGDDKRADFPEGAASAGTGYDDRRRSHFYYIYNRDCDNCFYGRRRWSWYNPI